MTNIRLGYACINMELQEKKEKVHCSRGMIRKTFDKQGVKGASKLALENVLDLVKMIKWNNERGIKVFRITSCLFPWASEYKLEQLPDFERISSVLAQAGKIAMEAGQRLSFHPGPFNILTSPKQKVVDNSYIDLEHHGRIFDLMGMPRNHWSKINIHIGASYGDPASGMERWCKNFEGLSESVRSRLTVENDDKKSLYSTKMLYEGIFKRVAVPIVWDSHHDELGPQDASPRESFEMAFDSWPKGIRPVCHHSNSKKLFEDSSVAENAHSDFYFKPFPDFAKGVDVVLEAKAKERALFKYVKDFGVD